MTREPYSDGVLEQLMTAWLDERAHGPGPDAVLDAALARTTRTRPLPAWLLPERWLPMRRLGRRQWPSSVVPVLVVVGLLLAAAVAVLLAGSQRRLPAPFGLAGNGRIAVVADGRIALVNADGSDLRTITSGPGTQSVPVFSPDGTKLAYVETPPDAETAARPTCLLVAHVDGTSPVSIEPICDGMSGANWSPDGRSVVYSRGYAPDIEQVFVAASDGSSPPRRIGDETRHSWGPGWSPDGHTISFVQLDPVTRREQLWVIDADGSGARQLTDGTWDHILGANQWRPDGNAILFAAGSDQTRYDLWMVDLDGRVEQLPLNVDLSAEVGVWSPDGTRIAYLNRTRGRLAVIHIFTLAEGSDRTLDGIYWTAPLGWSPDGRTIYMSEAVGASVRLALVDVIGSKAAVEIDVGPASATSADDPPSASWQRVAP